jgi:isopenicillin N synthase-like dioxygenase
VAGAAVEASQQQQQQPVQHVGCGTHTDCGFMTILAQVRWRCGRKCQ